MQTNLFQGVPNSKVGKRVELFHYVVIEGIEKVEITQLDYSFHDTPFGEILIAGSKKGVHWLAYVNNWREGLISLSESFPLVELTEKENPLHNSAAELIAGKKPKKKIKLIVSGSDFQLEVWQELLKIPCGKTTTYGEIAQTLNRPIGASRAIGTAVGKNPIAYLIPCHRVLAANGLIGRYMWGSDLKKEILLAEMR